MHVHEQLDLINIPYIHVQIDLAKPKAELLGQVVQSPIKLIQDKQEFSFTLQWGLVFML